MRKKLILLHSIHVLAFTSLLISGLALYLPTTRAWLNQLHFPLVAFHLSVACLYILIVLVSFNDIFKYLLKKPLIKKYNVYLIVLAACLWISSGISMYFQDFLPFTIRGIAVVIHDWSTFLFLPWAITHSVGHLLKIQMPWPKWWRAKSPIPSTITENQLERRDVLKFLVFGFFSIVFGGSIRWFSPILSIPSEQLKRRGYFRIYNVTNDIPVYENQTWSLTIDGRINERTNITLADIPRLPQTTIVTDFHCVTGWSVRNVEMKGILLKDLFDSLQLKTTGKFATVYSGDQIYFDSFTVEQLLTDEAILVFELDGQPLKNAQGYPCRLYHPSLYGYKSVKWVERIEFTDERQIGYWQQSGGYDVNGYL
ncbi:molybdopterin-dependent oxidoreductase [Neobacillus sp. D3-1R]|uniref:molybdopterin-dependent oxidoreductase n=1 Tax=Neobacillus sp. D3-1R TaxID=3445778 RepID=UPI003F9F9065